MTGENSMGKEGHARFVKTFQLRSLLKTGPEMEQVYRNTMTAVLAFSETVTMRKLSAVVGKNGSFLRRGVGYATEAIHLPERRLWSFRIDSEKSGIFEVALIERDGQLHLGGRAFRDSTLLYPIIPQFRFAQTLSKIAGLEPPISGQPFAAAGPDSVRTLFRHVMDLKRKYPVVIVSEVNSGQWRNSTHTPRYMIDPRSLAVNLSGIATVATLSIPASIEWSDLIGRPWTVYDGAVRTYYPGFDSREENLSRHPIVFKDCIWNFERDQLRGAAGFAAFLETIVRHYAETVETDWNGMFFLREAKILCDEVELIAKEHIRPTAQVVEQESLIVRNLTEQLRAKTEAAAMYQRQVITLKSELTKQRKRALEYRERCDEACVRMKAVLPNLPDSHNKVAEWAKRELAGRVYLHQRAERGLAKAQYQSPELICQALALLGTEYRNARLGLGSDYKFRKRCRELGLACKGSIERGRAGEEGTDYYVNYPVGSDSQCFLKMKLCKGNSYHRRYCLRIYFFWDEKAQLVVVGSLPHHLSNRAS